MATTIQTLLLLLAVMVVVAIAARRFNTAPSILLVIAGVGLALVPGLPRIELAPELVLLGILPPLIYSAGVAMSWREFRFNLRPIALLAFGVGPGDEVVTQANTCPPTASAIARTGARVVLCDVDETSGRIDLQSLEGAITERTKAVIPVHLYGQCADVAALRAALPDGVRVLEDCAQAHLAALDGRPAGAVGDAAAWSFYPSKNLSAWGDAGAVVSDDPELVERVRRLAHHGAGSHKYEHLVMGTNSRLDAVQAAVLRVKLARLEAWNEERRARARAYDEALAGVPGLTLPFERPGARSAWHLYTVRLADRDGLQAHLRQRGIATAVHYPKPLHLQPAMAGLTHGPLPVSEQLSREVLSIPLYPELPMETLSAIAGEVRTYCSVRSAPVRA